MNVKITGRGVKITDGIRDKIQSLISKHENLLDKATKIEVELKESISHSGVDQDLAVEITVSMPKVYIRVEKQGANFYAIVDEIDPVLKRRLVRYQDNIDRWERKGSWKKLVETKVTEEMKKAKDDKYVYEEGGKPLITRHKRYTRNSPMHPEEAIERMELVGHEAFLFKNIETGSYSMVYRRKDGTYGLVEPRNP